jgi:hypothetical protein
LLVVAEVVLGLVQIQTVAEAEPVDLELEPL